jgi:hypothetical protein
MEAHMGRSQVKAAEKAGIEAFLYNDDFAYLIKNEYNNYQKVYEAVRGVLDDAGVKVDPKVLDDIVSKIKNVGTGWEKLEELENSTGRKGMG